MYFYYTKNLRKCQLSSEIADKMQLTPEFVQSVEELEVLPEEARSKLYVLLDETSPDFGYVFAYMYTKKEVESKPTYDNLLDDAINSDGTPFVGTEEDGTKTVGYQNGFRLNSAMVEKKQDGCGYTGLIPAKAGNTLRFKNIQACTVGYGYIHYVKADKVTQAHTSTGIAASTFTVDENGVSSFTIPESNTSTAYIRLSYGLMSEDSIITIGQEITDGGGTESVTEYAWVNTELAFVSDNYEERIADIENLTLTHTEEIAELRGLIENNSNAPDNSDTSDVDIPNLITVSTDEDRITVFNKDETAGYKTGVRLSGSTGGEDNCSVSTYGITGFIPAKDGDTLCIEGFTGANGVATYVIAYDNDNKVTGYIQNPDWAMHVVGDGYAEQVLDADTLGNNFNAVRLCLNGLDGDTVVTYKKEGGSTSTNENKTSLMFISPDGNDSNDGFTESTPKKTVKACVNAGAKKISAKRGIYNEIVQFWDIEELEIFPTDNDLTYAVGVEREPIVFDTSDTVAVSSFAIYNSIKRAAYSNTANTQFDKVFTKKTQTPLYGSDYGSRYNATVWLLSEDEKSVCIKLKPVLTVAECEAEANTFTYVDGYIYINASWTNVAKVVVPMNWDCGIYINGAKRFVLKEVEVRFAGSYNIDIRNCAYFDFYKCACKYTSYGSGFHPFNSNGTMTACYATKNYDGYGISGYGHTTYVDCVSEFNFDDGMSHHDGTEGTIIGGRYEGNGKGGITPAYGAKVNIYGGLYKDNTSFGIGYLWSTGLESASGIVQGAVMVGNPIGLSVNANCNVTAINCAYKNNTVDKDNKGNLVEY